MTKNVPSAASRRTCAFSSPIIALQDVAQFCSRTMNGAIRRSKPTLRRLPTATECWHRMSLLGQSRSFWSVLGTSANPPVAELPLRPGQVSVVPKAVDHAYSITSSARAMRIGGMLRPIAAAVFRLMINSNSLASWIGKSAGLAPLRMRST